MCMLTGSSQTMPFTMLLYSNAFALVQSILFRAQCLSVLEWGLHELLCTLQQSLYSSGRWSNPLRQEQTQQCISLQRHS